MSFYVYVSKCLCCLLVIICVVLFLRESCYEDGTVFGHMLDKQGVSRESALKGLV